MTGILIGAVLGLVALGVLLGLVLSYASQRFAIEEDPRIEQVLEALPGINCGACGYAGCRAMAEAIVVGEKEPSGCPVGGQEVATKIAKLLGIEVGEVESQKAVVLCSGGIRAQNKMTYFGVQDCQAAVLIQNGPKVCEYACVGLGTCVEVCPFDALHMGEDGLPHVDWEACTGCGTCEQACPRGTIRVFPVSAAVHVRCVSHDKGAVVRKLCEAGCIACKRCEKACEYDAIHVINFLAEIDHEKCTGCGACIEVCPKHVIRRIEEDTVAVVQEAAASTN